MSPPDSAPAAADRTPPPVDSARAPRPRRPPRLLAIDLDGTLLDRAQPRLHPRNRDALRAAARGGLHVSVATGRMYRSALPWAEAVGARAPIICYQGAMVRALPERGAPVVDGVPQGELISEDPVDGDVALAALRVARAGGWHVQAYRDDRLLCDEDRPEAHLYARIAQVGIDFVADLEPVMALGSTKVVCVVEEEAEMRRCEAALAAEIGSRARVVRSVPEFVEITSRVAGKGRALRRVCARLGVAPEEVVAIGDAPNDADMLALAGFTVAIEGSPAGALPGIDCTCPPPDQAGVAVALEALGLVA